MTSTTTYIPSLLRTKKAAVEAAKLFVKSTSTTTSQNKPAFAGKKSSGGPTRRNNGRPQCRAERPLPSILASWGSVTETIRKADAEAFTERQNKSEGFAASGAKHTFTEVYRKMRADGKEVVESNVYERWGRGMKE
jgi:hypothetical protein